MRLSFRLMSMPSNLLKAGSVQALPEVKIIDSNALVKEKLRMIRVKLASEEGEGVTDEFVAGIHAEAVEELVVHPIVDEVAEAQKEAVDVRQAAESFYTSRTAEAERILAEAKTEVGRLEEEAKARGWKSGYQAGWDAAEQEVEEMKESIHKQAEQNQKEYEESLRTMEPELVGAIRDVFQKVTHVLSQDNKDLVLHLVSNAFERIEGSKQYLIRVSVGDYPYVSSHKDMLLEQLASGSEVEIMKDAILGQNQCMIETDSGVFDCSLDTQLENLVRAIRILSVG
jgi:flagellar assembly protein FliH